MKSSIQNIGTYLTHLQAAVTELPVELIDQIVHTLFETARRGNKVFICGNGGSASTASHFACDLAKNTIVPGAPTFRVIALNDNMALMTAWANDTAYDNVFAAQMQPWIEAGDVFIGISCSGNSNNVLKAIDVAHHHGAVTVGFTGDVGGRLKDKVDLCILAPSPFIEQQEDIHLVLEHCICAALRDRLLAEYAPIPQNIAVAIPQEILSN